MDQKSDTQKIIGGKSQQGSLINVLDLNLQERETKELENE